MADDVDHILFQHAQVALGLPGHGGAVEDIGHLGAGHGAAPAVSHAAAERLPHQGFRIRGAAHVGHVHGGDDLPVHRPGHDVLLHPDLFPFLGGPVGPALVALDLAVLVQADLRYLMGDIVDIPILGGNAPLLRQIQELGGVRHVVVAVGAGIVKLPDALTAMV